LSFKIGVLSAILPIHRSRDKDRAGKSPALSGYKLIVLEL